VGDTHFRDYRGTEGVIEDITNPPTRISGKLEIKPGQSVQRGTTTEQALAQERVPLEGEGERAFGAPMSTPPPQPVKKKED